jgi:hypothetical protein
MTPITDLKNIKKIGLGWEMLAAPAGAFLVMEECSHSPAYEIGRFAHDGSALSRSNAFREAQTLAGSRDKYNGEGFAFNSYEVEAEGATANIETMSRADALTMSRTARNIHIDIKRKYTSLKSLRVMKADIANPYYADRRERRFSPAMWDLILTAIRRRTLDTFFALRAIEYAADKRAAELAKDPENLTSAEAWQIMQNKRREREAAHGEALVLNEKVDADLANLRRDIAAIRVKHPADQVPSIIDYAIRHVFNRIVRLHGVVVNRDRFTDLQRTPEQKAYDNPPFRIGDRVELDGLTYSVTMNKGGGVVVLNDRVEANASELRLIERRDVITKRIAEKCGVSEDYALQALCGADMNETDAIRMIERRQEKDAAAAAAGLTDNLAINVSRLTYSEIMQRMQIENGSQGTRPVSRGFISLQITREESHLTPDLDTVRDVLRSQLVSCYAHRVLTAKDWERADEYAANAPNPRALISALRVALLRGLDIVEALKAES